MTNHMIPVFSDRFVASWPLHADGELTHYVPLADVLETPFPSDVHFAGYSAPSQPRRLHTTAPAALGVVPMVAAIWRTLTSDTADTVEELVPVLLQVRHGVQIPYGV